MNRFLLILFSALITGQVVISPTSNSGNSTIVGGTCTNQVVTAISAAGVPTCTTVTNSYTNSSIPVEGKPYVGTYLPNAKAIRVNAPNLATGDNDLYTVPAGKRAVVGGTNIYNNSAGNITTHNQVKISGTYYRVSNDLTITSGNSNQHNQVFMLEVDDIFSVNSTTTNGLNVDAMVLEFDSTSKLTQGRVTGPSTGNNTLFTCPASHTCIALREAPWVTTGQPFFFTADGSARSVFLMNVPSGQVAGNDYKLSPAFNINANSVNTVNNYISMVAGDFISMNVSTGNSAQIGWIIMLTIPN